MSNIIDLISRKWSQEVGTIDLKNHKHVATLSNMLLEMGMPFNDVQQSISRLVEGDDDKYVSIGYGRYKEKGKEKDPDADVFVKTDAGKYVKSSDQKSDDKDDKFFSCYPFDEENVLRFAAFCEESGGFIIC